MSGPEWVCDGCLRTVTRSEIAEMVDWEHVLCHACASVMRTDPRPPWAAS